ncbi:Maturin [Bienertia sinuspersici]
MGSEDYDDENESMDDEEENDDEDDEYMAMVNDHFNPYEDDGWDVEEDEEDNYFARLFKNGELFNDDEFGKIILKPWQLFMDKQHLRDVVRDYCIQQGFSIIVDRATNTRYTVLCSTQGCGWRLHASSLPDGVTWAIKSIQHSEHTCQGSETINPMVNTKWATRVLLEDIRANNDIPAKAMNLKLWQRYRIEMRPSTLYMVRKHALMEIHGGHDVSYGYLAQYCQIIRETNPNSTGIDNALRDLWPKAGRRYYYKHLSKNFKAQFPGPLMLSLF